jgi:hypothetical protein
MKVGLAVFQLPKRGDHERTRHIEAAQHSMVAIAESLVKFLHECVRLLPRLSVNLTALLRECRRG